MKIDQVIYVRDITVCIYEVHERFQVYDACLKKMFDEKQVKSEYLVVQTKISKSYCMYE